MNTNKGTFYGVSVGPGDPKLMTLKAVETLAACPVIAVPITNKGGTMALTIAQGAVDLSTKEHLKLLFPMTRDTAKTAEAYGQAADQIAHYLEQGKDVALVNIGDISVYSTFDYLLPLVKAKGYTVGIIPGVTSFCAIAAHLQVSLTERSLPLHIIPANYGSVKENLAYPGSKVLMKAGNMVGEIKEALTKLPPIDYGFVAENCGLPSERYTALGDATENSGYFTTILIKE